MKKVDLAYMAGLFDGEGCVSICKGKSLCKSKIIGKEKRYRTHYCLRVAASMANEFIPNWFKMSFGGSVLIRPRIGENWKDQWVWILGATQAITFLKALLPYLIIKKPHVVVAIKFQRTILKPGARNQYRRLTEEELAVRESYYLAIRALNKRGLL